MQSARQHVLKVLDRTHTPGRPEACVAEARAAGFEHVNLDLIYGTPGESDDDWRASLDAAIGAGPDHVSAYALIVEEGTQLARRIRRGEVPMTDDDVHADRYLIADEAMAAAGFDWYEVSNWATRRRGRCLHNELYWRGADWWGAGPGRAQPRRRRAVVERQASRGVRAGAGRGALARAPAGRCSRTEDRRVERILLELRLVEGCPLALLAPAGACAAAGRGGRRTACWRPVPYAEGARRADAARAAAGRRGGAGPGGLNGATERAPPHGGAGAAGPAEPRGIRVP